MYRLISTVILATAWFCLLGQARRAPAAQAVVCVSDGSNVLTLAGKEAQRYIYQCTGSLLPIVSTASGHEQAILLRIDKSLEPQQFQIKSKKSPEQHTLQISGGNDLGVLYGVYRFAEHLGVRFYLHGDVIPDQKTAFELPQLDETCSPLFPLRGIQPFHDFTEGPDWWSEDDYKAYLSQMVKLRMNWFGLHCYPEGGVGPEPLVWIGLPGDTDAKGQVTSSYPSRWASTLGGAWGYAPTKTSQYAAGAALLFPEDDYGPDVTAGYRPKPTTANGSNTVFNRAATMLRGAFEHGRALGIKICLGTETPLTIPKALQERLKQKGLDPVDPATTQALYEGMFTRISRAYPIDYYWLWTPEGWTWQGANPTQIKKTVRDIQLALAALDKLDQPFQLATCGWVLGPPNDRGLFAKIFPKSVPLSCINREVGFTPVEPEFSMIKERPKWAIPWMEDDPALIIPQLWAGRLRRDAADAHAYGCTGLMGIHWRTKVLGPNVAAMTAASWDQTAWNPDFGKRIMPPEPSQASDVCIGGRVAAYFQNQIQETDEPTIYKTCRYDVEAYHVKVPNGTYRVTLKFCEVAYNDPGKRVFGVKLQGKPLIDRLDVLAKAGKNHALDFSFDDVRVSNERLDIDFVKQVEFPFVAGIVIEGRTADTNQIKGKPFVRKINCGGKAYRDYTADLREIQSAWFPDKPRDMPCRDFYQDWCRSQFGQNVAKPLTDLFVQLDGGPGQYQLQKKTRLPRPSTWIHGPGGIAINKKSWNDEKSRYAFVDQMASLRSKVQGPGDLARFDYWLNTFRYLRSIGQLGCARGQLDHIMTQLKKAKQAEQKHALAESALAVRMALARQWEQMMTYQLAVVSTPGEMGTIANLEQHVRRTLHLLDAHDAELAKALGRPLPTEIQPSRRYLGQPRLIVPTKRSRVSANESLTIPALLLDSQPPEAVTIHWRPMGEQSFQEVRTHHVAHGLYQAELAPTGDRTIEYYVSATLSNGHVLKWPATAPRLNQTVVVAPSSSK